MLANTADNLAFVLVKSELISWFRDLAKTLFSDSIHRNGVRAAGLPVAELATTLTTLAAHGAAEYDLA